jgi:flagellin
MSVVVNTNIQSLIGQNSLNRNTSALNNTLQQLSTGSRINSAKDDAAGLGVAEQMTAQIRGNAQAMSNIQDGMNLIQTAEGGLSVITDNIQRIRELCIQAANEIYYEESKQAIMNEISQRLKTVDTIAKTTNFNGKSLIDGTVTSLSIQTGPNGDDASANPKLNALDIGASLTDAKVASLGINLDVVELGNGDATANKYDGATWTTQKIRDYITVLDTAINKITSDMSMMGAYMNSMESSAENLTTINLNLEAARSKIRDVDVAQASSDMIRYQRAFEASAKIFSTANDLMGTIIGMV